MSKKQTVGKRLSESKRQASKQRFDDGMKLGRNWAEEYATADELELLARSPDVYISIADVAHALGHDIDYLVGDVDLVTSNSDHFAQGFVAGAMVVVAEHSEILDIDPDIIAGAIDDVPSTVKVTAAYENSAQDFRFDRAICQVFAAHNVEPDSGQCLISGQRDFVGCVHGQDHADSIGSQIRAISPDILVN